MLCYFSSEQSNDTFFHLSCYILLHLIVATIRTSQGPFTQTIFVAQLNAMFVAPKLQLQYRTCKPAATSARFYRRDIAGVSNLFET